MAYDDRQTELPLPGDGSEKRKSEIHLPKYFRTESNTKFLSSTLDQLLQPGVAEKLNGYFGRKTATAFNPSDTYIADVSKDREDYQFEPASVITDALGNVEFFKNYNDLINQVKNFGGVNRNHSNINKEEFYTWDPHINWDKFTNFREYYWLPTGPQTLNIVGDVKEITSTYSVSLQDNGDNYSYIFSPDGLTPNGSTGFMDTGLNPSSQLSIDNLSFTYYCRTNDARASYDCGVTTTTTGTNLSLNASLRWSDNTTYYSLLHNPTELSKSQTNSAKYFIFNKPSSTSVVLFENTTKTTSTVSNRSLVNANFYLGARNLNGSASDYSNKQCALLTIGESFNDTEASNLYTAVNAFQVSLSRNV